VFNKFPEAIVHSYYKQIPLGEMQEFWCGWEMWRVSCNILHQTITTSEFCSTIL